MTVDQRLNQIQAAQQELRELAETLAKRGGGGGGHLDRISRLEARVDRMSEELAGTRVNLATLTERVAHLPSKGFIVAALLSTLAVVAALITFGEKLHNLVN